MTDIRIGAATKLLIFGDDFHVKPEALCSILGERPNGLGDMLLEVMFHDGVKRLVKKDEVRDA